MCVDGMVSTAIAVTLSENPHTYVLHMVVDKNFAVLMVYRDDGYRYVAVEKIFQTKKLDISIASRLVDKVAKMIIEEEGAELFIITTGSGLLNMSYTRRKA